MKLKKKIFCILVVGICIVGFSSISALAASADEKTVEIIDTEYTGKELPDPATQFSGEFSVGIATMTDEEATTALPTPIPTTNQMSLIEEDTTDRIYVEEYVVNGKTITIKTYFDKGLEDVVLPEGFSEVTTTVLYANDSVPITRASYTPKTKTFQRQFLVDGELASVVTATYEIWYYTDNKVHLYSRSFSKTAASGYGNSYLEYGSIINTDGSLSYTSGDYYHLIGQGVNTTNAINFIVTPTYYDFH